MGLSRDDVQALACPRCHSAMAYQGSYDESGSIRDGVLSCQKEACARSFPVRGGLPHLLDERTVGGSDRLLRPIYDFIAPLHDLGVTYVLPLLQVPDRGASRNNYMRVMELEKLESGENDPPPRILEIGIGAGANVALLRGYLPAHVVADVWGVDLSAGMLAECRSNLKAEEYPKLRLALADAHALPFPDSFFDRVFHVGAINGYRNRPLALTEMARVAKPATPIVVVDEELDPNRQHSRLHRIAFQALTLYDSSPTAPIAELPKGAVIDSTQPVSRFYYCLKFSMPADRDGQRPGELPETPAAAARS